MKAFQLSKETNKGLVTYTFIEKGVIKETTKDKKIYPEYIFGSSLTRKFADKLLKNGYTLVKRKEEEKDD